MAFTFGGALGTAQSKGTLNVVTITTGATAPVGSLVVVCIGVDNVATTDGDHGEVTSVVDSAGNLYLKAGEHTNAQGAAGGGSTVAVWQSVLAAQLSSGGTITVTLGANVGARSAIAGYWTIGKAGVAVAGLVTQATDGADPATLTLADLPSREYLCIGAGSYEGPYGSDSYAADGAFSAIADAGSGAFGIGTTGGEAVTNQSVGAGYRILTGTGASYDATIASNRDSAGLLVALYEVDVAVIQPDNDASKDTFINADYPNNPYDHVMQHLWVGEQRFGEGPYRTLIQFDLGAMPEGVTIAWAALVLTVESAWHSNDAAGTFSAHRISRTWVAATVTWNNYDGTNAWSTAGGDYEAGDIGTMPVLTSETTGTKKRIWLDPTAVQEWLDGEYANNGLLLRSTNEAVFNSHRFYNAAASTSSQRPALIIGYEAEGGGGEIVELAASISVASDAPDSAMLLVTREMVAALSADSTATPVGVLLAVERAFTALMDAAGSTPTVPLAVERALSASAAGTSTTPDDVMLSVAALLAATVAASSGTPEIELSILRALSATLLASGAAPDDVVLSIAGIVLLSALMSAQGETPDDATLAVIRPMLAELDATTSAPDDVAIILSRIFAAEMFATSDTSDTATLLVTRLMVAAILAVSSTPDSVRLLLGEGLTEVLFRGMARGHSRKMGR